MNNTVIVILGASGVGKSALCNRLIKDTKRKPFAETYSTKPSNRELIQQLPVKLRTGHDVTLVDTEGFASPDISDQTLFDQLHQRLKKLNKVNRFVIVLNGAEPRLDSKFQTMINKYIDMLGPEFHKFLSIVFTRWDYDPKSIKTRERQNVSEAGKKKEINTFFAGKTAYTDEIPCFFLDCGFEEGGQGAEQSESQLNELIKSCLNSGQFLTANVKEVKTTLYPTLNASNSKSGDEYARRMEKRKDVVGRVESYFDNRDFEVVPSLLNDTHRAEIIIDQQDTEIRISQVNFKVFIVRGLKTKHLYDNIQFSLSDLLKQKVHGDSKFSFPKDCITNIGQEQEENLFINKTSIAFVVIGIIVGLILALSSVSAWYLDIPVLAVVAFVIYLLYSKFSWKKHIVLRELAVELTQRIAYTNHLKRLTIEFVDKNLDKE